MSRIPRTPLASVQVSRRATLAMLSSTAVLAACGGDGGGGSPGPAPTPAPTPTPPPPPVNGPAWFSYGHDAQHTAVELTRSVACDVEFWPVLDPTGMETSREETLATYRMVRDQLQKRILERFPISET